MRSSEVGEVDFPTLGHLLDAWIEQHCRVPGGFSRGKPFRQADWQFWCTANHYRVREGLEFVDPDDATEDSPVLLNQAFTYRRSQVTAPQKTGKGPWTAAITAAEAVGPTVFAGYAKRGERYYCSDHGCACGWSFRYKEGEPKGMRHPSPLIQLTATSEDQVDNVFGALRSMIALGPLKPLLRVREGFVRIVGNGHGSDDDMDRIDAVSSSANSRVGNPISFAIQDESGLYTVSNKMRKVAEAQRRGAAGMGGRTIETTNAWDPTEGSVAQSTYESPSTDIFRFYRNPDMVLRDKAGHPLRYSQKRDRTKIHEYAYEGSWWVNLDSIEAEAAELMQHDPAQAERFFGNRLVMGAGSWLPDGAWAGAYAGR